jgi:hypothetical protein
MTLDKNLAGNFLNIRNELKKANKGVPLKQSLQKEQL